MRLFLAVDPPREFKQRLKAVQSAFRGSVKAVFVSPQIFHVTLLFLGEVRAQNLDEIKERVSPVSSRFAPLSFDFSKVGYFGRGKHSSLVVLFKTGPTFGKLKRQLRRILLGLVKFDEGERVERSPHLTLFRFKGGGFRPGFSATSLEGLIKNGSQSLKGLGFTAQSFFLCQSRLTSQGPIYTKMLEFPFTDLLHR